MNTQTIELMQNIEDNFDKLQQVRDPDHILIILHGDGEKINAMASAPNLPTSIFTMLSAAANQMKSVNDPELAKGMVITLTGMLGVNTDDEFVEKMRNDIQRVKDAALVHDVKEATEELTDSE